MALLKFSCPWKRYLTQAQLLQFTSVVVYTIFTAYLQHKNLPHEAIEGVQPSLATYYWCCIVQVFEMVSLFFLFSLFYKRSYANKKKAAAKESEDQCHKAMGEISEAAKEVAGHAAKDAGKIVASASKVVKRNTRVGAM